MRHVWLVLLAACWPALALAQEVAVVFSYGGSGITALFATPESRAASERQVAQRIARELGLHSRYWKFAEQALPPKELYVRGRIEPEGNRYQIVLEIHRKDTLIRELWRTQLYEPHVIAMRGLPVKEKLPEDVGARLSKDFPRDLDKLKGLLRESFPLATEADLRSPPHALLKLAWSTHCGLAASTFRIVGVGPAGPPLQLTSSGTWSSGFWRASTEKVLMVEHKQLNDQALRKAHYSTIQKVKQVHIWLAAIRDEEVPCGLGEAL